MDTSHATQEEARKRFAVTPHERGVAIFRGASEGLRCAVSSDGVRWEPESSAGEGAGSLWPICSGEAAGRTRLFCRDREGMVLGLSTREGRLSPDEPFQPVESETDWYEAAPEPQDMAIVRDAAGAVYRAFFCARRKTGRQPERRACIGAATSHDLHEWNTEPPIFAPNAYPKLFSPHVFCEDGRAVLFYATAEEGNLRGLRYALAPRLEGPYERSADDLIACDSRTTVHTVRLGGKRLVFFGRGLPGEAPAGGISRPGRLDFRADGRPFVRFYEPLLGILGKTLFQTEATLTSGEILARVLPRYGANFRLTARVRSRGAQTVGVLIRTTITGHDNITLWLDFQAGALILRRGVKGRLLARRARQLATGTEYRLGVWAEGGFADVYLDDEWVLTCETEARRSGGFGLAVYGGEARFEDVAAQQILETRG